MIITLTLMLFAGCLLYLVNRLDDRKSFETGLEIARIAREKVCVRRE